MFAPLLSKQAMFVCVTFQPIKEGRIMSKAISTLIAAVAALTLSGGAFAQTAGGANGGGANGSTGSTASPANQVNRTPGTYNSESGMSARAPNSGLPSGTNGTSTASPAPKTNNTLATPSVVSPAAGQSQ